MRHLWPLLLLGCRGGCADPERPGESPAHSAEDSQADSPEDSAAPLPGCEGEPPEGELLIDAGWTLVASPEAWALAEHLRAGDLMMGCEDGLPPMPLAEAAEGPALILDVDPSLAPQSYRVRYDAEHICITGGDSAGLQYGALDWLASLEEVRWQGGGSWRPDPGAAGTQPTACSDYDPDCGADEACWSEGAWTPVQDLRWDPQAVDNAPALPLRMAFASFNGTYSSNFTVNLLYAGLGRCVDPEDSAPFWAATLGCDPLAEGSTCSEVRVRLDSLVAGRFTHALDEGHALAVDDSVLDETGCEGAVLQADLERYLAERQLTLIPTVYGLESRAAASPIAGPRVDEDLPTELWGVGGDVSLSQGIGLERSFVACSLAGGVYLAPDDCSVLDAQGRVQGPLPVSATYDVDHLTPPTSVNDCGPLELCATRAGCWEAVEGTQGQALSPAAECSNPVLRWILPQDGRWYVLHFLASLPASRDLTVKMITRDTEGFTNAAELPLLSTAAEENHYLHPEPGLNPEDPGVVRFSVVFQAPAAHARLDDAYLQILGVPGSGAWVDALFLAELEGQLHDLDPESPRGLDCAVVEGAPEPPLPAAPFFDAAEGAVTGAAIRADCLEPGDRVTLRWRSWTHFGLWPGLSTRQLTYTWTPDVYSARYWDDPRSPGAQARAYTEAEWLLLSDLGGEARGLDRLGPLSETEADETLASYVCAVEAEACAGCGDCSDALLPLDDPGFAPCDCAAWPSEAGPRLLLAGDMFTPYQNGGDKGALAQREGYQLPHGGDWEATWPARDAIPADAVFLSWWHYDTARAGAPVGDAALGFALDLLDAGHEVIGASAWDPDNQRAWAALAAGHPGVIGAAQYGWGSDAQGPRVLREAGRTFWNPGWAWIDGWLMSQDPLLPGGDESGEWDASGFALQDTTASLSWPQAGTWLVVEGESATWTSPATPVQGARVLARMRGALPEGCTLTWGFAFDDPDGSVITEDQSPEIHDYRAWSASVERPPEASEVQLSLRYAGCAGASLDALSLYDSLPQVDFPTPYAPEHLLDWDSAESADARAKICGDGATWDCVNAASWE
ncbi:MAG: hypothetical protein H6741_08125 [Alphaproteobacteria bacterium]|nr:hypothetical protein [Alphaproteobacteria bacterium]